MLNWRLSKTAGDWNALASVHFCHPNFGLDCPKKALKIAFSSELSMFSCESVSPRKGRSADQTAKAAATAMPNQCVAASFTPTVFRSVLL